MANLVGQQFGNYRLLKLLGSGGFAEVYEAEHIHLGTYAAIKVSFGQLSPQNQQKFRDEAYYIAKLIHPNIVRFLEYGIEQNGMPFFVMEYAPHGTLRDCHPHGSLLPIATILSYIKQVAAALQFAHNQKIIHRDIKPENMLVDANNNILVSDFGIAVTAHRTHSLTTQDKFGTVYYMAPEHIQGKPRPASDQYSLGIVVYEWLSGSYPFDGLSDIEIAMKHLVEPPPSFNKNLKISPLVERVIMKALSKDPGKRYLSVQAFSDALEQAATPVKKAAVKPPPPKPQPPKPQPINPNPPVPLQRRISRKQFLIGAGILGLGLVGFEGVTHLVPAFINNKQLAATSKVSTGTIETYRGHTDVMEAVAWSSDGQHIASGGWDGTVQVWEALSGRQAFIYQGHNGSHVYTVAWSPNGEYIASGGTDGTVQVWEAFSGQKVLTYQGDSGNYELVNAVAWSPDGKYIASGGDVEGLLQVWEVLSGNQAFTHHEGTGVDAISWSPDGKYIALGTYNGLVQVLGAMSGQVVLTYGHSVSIPVDAVAWSPSGKYIASGGRDDTAQVWDTSGNRELTYHETEWVNSVAWSPNGMYIASASRDQTVQIWEASNGNRKLTYHGHSGGVNSVAWSPDGKYIASGSDDHTVQVWKAML